MPNSTLSREIVPRRYNLLALLIITVAICTVVTILAWPPPEVDLAEYERSVFSQGGEDGVLEKIFELIPPTSRFAVEFGSGDGVTLSNVRNLVLEKGWGALFIEGDPNLAQQAADTYRESPRVSAIQAWVFPGNIEILFEENGVPQDLDLVSIDIDSNDYYVWRALHWYRPKVVLIEFNASFPPPQKVVVDFHPLNYWDGSDYYGASIQSLYELGQRKGYELVHCNTYGANLFFVDRRYYRRFGIVDNSPARMYRVPQYGHHGRAPNGRGHPAWDLYTIQTPDGATRRPFDNDLTWEDVTIPKVFVSR
jgi:hypothetical protein